MAGQKFAVKKDEVAKAVPRMKDFNLFITKHQEFQDKYGTAGLENAAKAAGAQKKDWQALKVDAKELGENFVSSEEAKEFMQKSSGGWRNNLVHIWVAAGKTFTMGFGSILSIEAASQVPDTGSLRNNLYMLGGVLALNCIQYAEETIRNFVNRQRLKYAMEIMPFVEKVLGKKQASAGS